ncbi:FAD-dependent oxidoreductase, partial [Salmonella sp. s51228]|uniref:FAD-dependent oxidoreductase n=1 Tax=Salmonella sp. s51228 TaxID=3159652 RepID=UPI00397FAE7D
KSRNLCGNITQIFPEPGNMGLIFPCDLAKWATEKVRQQGVTVHPGVHILGVYPYNKRVHVVTSGGDELIADNIVMTVGLLPNTGLAESANLET